MRNFIEVLEAMIKQCEGNFELKKKLEQVYVDSTFTAPEALWDIRGRQVSDILYNYAVAGDKPYSNDFLDALCIFTEKPETELRQFIQTVRKDKK